MKKRDYIPDWTESTSDLDPTDEEIYYENEERDRENYFDKKEREGKK